MTNERLSALDAPPMFVALAADYPLFAKNEYGLISAWKTAGRPVEFHLYQNGGHGFGLGNPGKTSTGWFPQFMLWLEMNGMLQAGSEAFVLEGMSPFPIEVRTFACPCHGSFSAKSVFTW